MMIQYGSESRRSIDAVSWLMASSFLCLEASTTWRHLSAKTTTRTTTRNRRTAAGQPADSVFLTTVIQALTVREIRSKIIILVKCNNLNKNEANIGSQSAFSLQQGKFEPRFQVEGVAPLIILLVEIRDCNPGIPDPGIPGSRTVFQSRNPGIMRDQIPGFRD